MKKTIVALAMLAAFAAQAQDSSSTSNSGSNSGSASTAGATAIGNVNSSAADSASQSRATSGSSSGAAGNVTVLNQNVPDVQTVNQTSNNSSTVNSNVTGNSTVNENNRTDVNYTGGVRNFTEQGGTVTNRIEHVNSQKIKNVPSIAMSGPASGPCTGISGGLGLAGPGWGIGVNGAALQMDCVVRENVRVLGMGMQSLDGAASPQEKGEATVMFMDAMRGLAAMNAKIIMKEVGEQK